MNLNDLYLLSPELAVASVAILIVLVDLVVKRKEILPVLAILGLSIPCVMSISLWGDVDSGGQQAGMFGTLVVDKFSIFLKFILLASVASVILSSTEYVRKFTRFQGEYYALILFSTSGMMLLTSTTELITIYVALELTALPLAALAAFLRDGRSIEAGLKFLLLSAVSSAILLYGIVMVYGITGTTSLLEIADRIPQLDLNPDIAFGSHALLFGLILIIAGFGFKIASVPFQMWAPDVYEGAPTPVTMFLSVASKAAGFAVIIRIFSSAFLIDVLSVDWAIVFAVLSALSMTIGNLVAIRQSNIKRLMGYSTVAHAGYILMGMASLGYGSEGSGILLGPSGMLFYLAGFAVTNITAFAVVIAVSQRLDSYNISAYSGVARRAPFLAAALALAMVSLTGLPPAVGFWAKIYLFGAAVDAGLTWLVVIGVLNSVVSAYYYLRIVKAMYLAPAESEETIITALPIRAALLFSFLGTLIFGIYPAPLLALARTAASAL